MKQAASAWSLWGWPVLLAVATAVGLVGGLVGDGDGDCWPGSAWLPSAAALWFGWRGRAARG